MRENQFLKGVSLGKLTMLQWLLLYPEIYKTKIGLYGLWKKINKAHVENMMVKYLGGDKENRVVKHGQNTLYIYKNFHRVNDIKRKKETFIFCAASKFGFQRKAY